MTMRKKDIMAAMGLWQIMSAWGWIWK